MIDVCVSTHDNARELPAVLASLLPLRSLLGRVRVIDNGSADGGPGWVRRHHPWAEVLELGRNGGPAASRNAALLAPGADWALLLDGDCSLAAGCVEALLRVRAESPAQVYSPRVAYADDPDLIYYDAGEAHFLGLLCLDNAGVRARSALAPRLEPGAVSTSALLVHRPSARRAGLFDERYFFFGEDLDFSLRLRAAGFRLRHAPGAVVLHHKPLPGSDRACAQSARRSPMRSRRQGPNRWRTLLKVCRLGTLLRAAPLHAAYECAEALNAAREGNAAEYLAGWVELLRDLPAVLRARRTVQAFRTREDDALFVRAPLPWRAEVLAVPGARLLRGWLEAACRYAWPAPASAGAEITRPSRMATTRSAPPAAARSWAVTRTVRPG